jgi:hypothetical protein
MLSDTIWNNEIFVKLIMGKESKNTVKIRNIISLTSLIIIVPLILLFSIALIKVALKQKKQQKTKYSAIYFTDSYYKQNPSEKPPAPPPESEKKEIHPLRIEPKKIETELLKQYPNKAERKGKDLLIKKDGKIIKTYTDIDEPGRYILTKIENNLLFIQHTYDVGMTYYTDYFVINADTGQEINIAAMPVWSPSKKSFAVVNNGYGDYTGDTRQLWDIENEMLIKKWGENKPADSTEWKNDNHLIITSETEGFFGWEDEVIECLRNDKDWVCSKLDIITAVNKKYITPEKFEKRKSIYMTIAVRKNQPELAKFLFEKDYKISESNRILWEIVGFKRMEILKMFLEHTDKQKIKKHLGGGPLIHSARFAYADILEIILQAGADPNIKTGVYSDRRWGRGNTALMELAKTREEIKLILNRDNIKFTGKKFTENEIDEIIAKYPKIAELLLKYGARTDIRNAQGMDFLDMMEWHSPKASDIVKWHNLQLYEFIKKYSK